MKVKLIIEEKDEQNGGQHNKKSQQKFKPEK